MLLNVIRRISDKVEGQIHAVDHGTCGMILPSKTRGTTCTCLLPHIAVDFPTSPWSSKRKTCGARCLVGCLSASSLQKTLVVCSDLPATKIACANTPFQLPQKSGLPTTIFKVMSVLQSALLEELYTTTSPQPTLMENKHGPTVVGCFFVALFVSCFLRSDLVFTYKPKNFSLLKSIE